MTKKVIAGSLALLAVTAMYAQTYQLPNVGFENWEKAKGILWTEKSQNQGQPGQEPQSWHSSNIKFATGWAGSYQELVQKSDNGKTYANVINKKSGQASSYIPTLGTLTIGNTWYANYGDAMQLAAIEQLMKSLPRMAHTEDYLSSDVQMQLLEISKIIAATVTS